MGAREIGTAGEQVRLADHRGGKRLTPPGAGPDGLAVEVLGERGETQRRDELAIVSSARWPRRLPRRRGPATLTRPCA